MVTGGVAGGHGRGGVPVAEWDEGAQEVVAGGGVPTQPTKASGALQRLGLGPSPIAPPTLPPAHRLQLPCRAVMGQQKRHRYEQQGLPGTGVPAERYGPERPGPTLETIEQGQLQVEPLGPLFEGAAVEGGPG